jgi:tripartite-type tricarboxylate transporter receptor subunit TctC
MVQPGGVDRHHSGSRLEKAEVGAFHEHAMKLPRRQFLHLAAGAATVPAVMRFAWAQAYPSRPVRVIFGFPAGGGSDTIARLMGQWLTERLGQAFVIENRPGNVTNIATEAVVTAPADGYTLLLATSPNATNATLYPNLNFNFIRDIAPVASIGRIANIMEVNPSFPARTVDEFITYTKANPGKISFGSTGNGTTGHMSGELFKMMTGVNMVHVPYPSAPPALADLIAGNLQVMFDPLATSMEHIRAGRLRPMAVTTSARFAMLPDIPPLSNFLPGYESSAWFGFGAPKGTPIEIIERLNREINAGLADANVKERLADLGVTVVAGSSAAFGRFIADETEKWGNVVSFAGIKVE